MALKFMVSDIVPASSAEIYKAWLDSKGHSKMTGAKARVSNKVGDSFQAWDGYISGTNLELTPDKKIVQSWRTVEFDESEADSRIEVTLEDVKDGTKIKLEHTNLPPHGAQYEQGWIDNYFEPMKKYFSK